jgi:hypothetical protein
MLNGWKAILSPNAELIVAHKQTKQLQDPTKRSNDQKEINGGFNRQLG